MARGHYCLAADSSNRTSAIAGLAVGEVDQRRCGILGQIDHAGFHDRRVLPATVQAARWVALSAMPSMVCVLLVAEL